MFSFKRLLLFFFHLVVVLITHVLTYCTWRLYHFFTVSIKEAMAVTLGFSIDLGYKNVLIPIAWGRAIDSLHKIVRNEDNLRCSSWRATMTHFWHVNKHFLYSLKIVLASEIQKTNAVTTSKTLSCNILHFSLMFHFCKTEEQFIR